MSKYDIEPRGEHWQRLQSALRAMSTLLDGPQVNVVELAKIYEASAQAMLLAVRSHGLSSMRFEAAYKALDLTTPKSALEAFLGPRSAEPTH